ncbi:MAG: hypothetical protein QXZ12_06855 [Thermoplasmata archaeon]
MEKNEMETETGKRDTYVKIDVFGFYGDEYSIIVDGKPVACKNIFTGNVGHYFYADEGSEIEIISDNFTLKFTVILGLSLIFIGDNGGNVSILIK